MSVPPDHHRWSLTWLGSDRLVARRLARPMARFLHVEAAGGILLLVGALVAVVWVNSPLGDTYHHVWETPVALRAGGIGLELSLHEWINDGAMALFFFVVGMEIKREIVAGELRDPRAAALPVIGAIGGMVVPALLYLAVNRGGPAAAGWGIPMATDIAFAVGIVSLLGSRVPSSLKLFLLSLAVADDLGAIAVVAVAYSQGFATGWLAAAVAVFVVIRLLRGAHVWFLPVYVVLGIVAWYCTLRSGVHATVAGVVLGFLTPSRPLRDGVDPGAIADRLENRDDLEPEDVRDAAFHIREALPLDLRLIDRLHPWTGYLIVPSFALANAGVSLRGDVVAGALTSSATIGVFVGLVVGKTVGVLGASVLAAKLGIARLPAGAGTRHLVGIAMAAGIGFTVSIFMTTLALDDPVAQNEAKIGIFVASIVAAALSTVVLRSAGSRPTEVVDVDRLVAPVPVAPDGVGLGAP